MVAAHTGQVWTVAFCGFAPGFGYLLGENDRLRVPRRSNPRTAVPAGAVGLADALSGVYPRARPGRLAADRADRPAALGSGRAILPPCCGPVARVRFRARPMIIVDQPGPLATIQDLGRPGLAHLGVSPSGAADRTAHRLANRLVGNAESRATTWRSPWAGW